MKNKLRKTIAAAAAMTTLASYMYTPLSKSGDFSHLFCCNQITADSTPITFEEYTYEDYTYSVFLNQVSIKKYTGKSSEVVIPDTIDGMPVEKITDGAFKECTGVTSVILPKTLESIGDKAFSDTSIQSITIPASVKFISDSFSGCSKLTEVSFEEGCTQVPSFAFTECHALTTVNLPKGITSIGWNAFWKCSALETITLPDTLESIGKEAFTYSSLKSVKIPSSVTSINSAFAYCSDLTEISFADGCTSIPNFSFADCWALTSVRFPKGLVSIGKEAFVNCSALETITLPDTLESIGSCAFYNCPLLASVNFPKGLKFIGENAFLGCTALETVRLPEGLDSIGKNSFSRTSIKSISIPASVSSIDSSFSLCCKLTEASFEDGCTSIPDYSFDGCPALTSVKFPKEIKSIGDRAFKDCSSLESVILPEGITDIGFNAFSGTSIKSINIPLSVSTMSCAFGKALYLTNVTFTDGRTVIPESSFNGCYALFSIILPDSVTCIEYGAFENCLSLESIILPDKLNKIETRAFYGSSLKSINIPASVTQFSDSFKKCSKLTDVYFADGLTKVPSLAFRDCQSLKTVNLSESVSEIGRSSFISCPNLDTINSTREEFIFYPSSFKMCPKMHDLRVRNIDMRASGISAVAGEDDTVNYTIKYKLSNRVAKDSKKLSVIVDIPRQISLITDSISCDNATYEFDSSDNLVLLLGNREGVIKFSAHTPETGNYPLSAYMNFICNDTEWLEQIGVINSVVAAASPEAEKSALNTGDVNGDGKLTTSDARMILQNAVGIIEFTDEQKKLADINKDGKISTTDAAKLLRMIVGE